MGQANGNEAGDGVIIGDTAEGGAVIGSNVETATNGASGGAARAATGAASGNATAGRRMIDVVGAAIVRDGRVLCAQRGPGKSLAGLWEFPGGKIEAHETPREALHREIEEELRCEVEVADEVCTSAYAYDFGTVRLTTFICHLTDGTPRLTEHADVRWELPQDMPRLDWAPADREAVAIIAGMRELQDPRSDTQTPQDQAQPLSRTAEATSAASRGSLS